MMQETFRAVLWATLIGVVLAIVCVYARAEAQVVTMGASTLFNNDNLLSTPQPAPVAGVGPYDFGDMQIIPLEQGKTLIVHRYILEPEYGVNIWRYEMDDAYWFVTNKGVIYGVNNVGAEPMAETGLQALSIYLTL